MVEENPGLGILGWIEVVFYFVLVVVFEINDVLLRPLYALEIDQFFVLYRGRIHFKILKQVIQGPKGLLRGRIVALLAVPGFLFALNHYY